MFSIVGKKYVIFEFDTCDAQYGIEWKLKQNLSFICGYEMFLLGSNFLKINKGIELMIQFVFPSMTYKITPRTETLE